MFDITGEIDEPIYIKYGSDCETFYNSVVVFNIENNSDVEIVEEFESHGALNSVANYIIHSGSKLKLATFYQNYLSATSCCLRNVIVQEAAEYSHILFGKGSSTVIDENRIQPHSNTLIELLGCVDSNQSEFHSIFTIHPMALDYKFLLDYRHIVSNIGKVTLTPIVVGYLPDNSSSNITSLMLDAIPEEDRTKSIDDFLSTLVSRAVIERNVGVDRFYKNKSKFLQNQ